MATLTNHLNEGMSVHVPHLVTQNPSHEGEGVFVRFEGRKYPTGYRGEGMTRTWEMSAIYGGYEHEEAADLLEFLDAMFVHPDGRIRLDLDKGQDERLNTIYLVQIHQWSELREGAGILTVNFSATVVGEFESA